MASFGPRDGAVFLGGFSKKLDHGMSIHPAKCKMSQSNLQSCWRYCWWFRNPAPPLKNLVNNGISCLSTGAGFLPSTVLWVVCYVMLSLFRQQKNTCNMSGEGRVYWQPTNAPTAKWSPPDWNNQFNHLILMHCPTRTSFYLMGDLTPSCRNPQVKWVRPTQPVGSIPQFITATRSHKCEHMLR